MFANRGVDTSYGGAGDDALWALARGDVTALGDPIGDALHGDGGDDRFRTRDGEVDRIECGAGNDTALLDPFDVIVDASTSDADGSCERVERAEPRTGEDGPENGTESPPEDSLTR